MNGVTKIGTLWYQDQATVQQEHFASELASKHIQSWISSAPQSTRKERIFLGCPEGEFHTLPLLNLNLLLRNNGWQVDYFGANIPTIT